MTLFDGASLAAAVTTTLAAAQIPADHTHAFAVIATTDGAVKAVLSMKLDATWQIDAVVDFEPGAGVAGGVQVKATW